MNPVYVDRLVQDRQAELLHAARRARIPSGPDAIRHRLLPAIGHRFGYLLMRIGERLIDAADSALSTDAPTGAARLSQGHR